MADKQPYDFTHMRRTLDSLMVAWKMQPYQRLGQLLMNAGATIVDTHGGAPDLFYVEDDKLAASVMKYSEDQCQTSGTT